MRRCYPPSFMNEKNLGGKEIILWSGLQIVQLFFEEMAISGCSQKMRFPQSHDQESDWGILVEK